jgi:hypothetical protein
MQTLPDGRVSFFKQDQPSGRNEAEYFLHRKIMTSIHVENRGQVK